MGYSKGFDASAPLSPIKQADSGEPADARIWLEVNGELRQDAKLSDMIWSVPEILAQLSRYYALRAGDLVFTGTPAGVSSVVAGDRIQGGIEGVGEVQLSWFPERQFTADQAILLSILSALLVLLVWGRWRYDIVALGALFTASLFGLVPQSELFSGFGNPATITVVLVLIVSYGLTKSGAVDYLIR